MKVISERGERRDEPVASINEGKHGIQVVLVDTLRIKATTPRNPRAPGPRLLNVHCKGVLDSLLGGGGLYGHVQYVDES